MLRIHRDDDQEHLNLKSWILSGHTDAGKTTTLRSITRQNVGEVGVRTNKTLEPDFVPVPGIARLGDSAGFNCVLTLDLFQSIKSHFREFPDQIQKFLATTGISRYDIAAADALKLGDRIIYVADLTGSPNDGHLNEIRLIKATKKPVICLLNKGRLSRLREPTKAVERRQLWIDFLNRLEIRNVLEFDAFTAGLADIKRLFDSMKCQLPPAQRAEHDLAAAVILNEMRSVRRRAAECVGKFFVACRDTRPDKLINALTNSKAGAKQQTHDSFQQTMKAKLNEFITELTKLYGVEYDSGILDDLPAQGTTIQKPDGLVSSISESTHVVHGMLIGTTVGTTVCAIIGGILGAMGTIGTGAAPTAYMFAQYGGFVMAALSGLWGYSATNKSHVTTQATETDMDAVARFAISFAWATGYHGYGSDLPIDKLRYTEIDDLVVGLMQNNWKINWKVDDEERVATWCESILVQIDGELPLDQPVAT